MFRQVPVLPVVIPVGLAVFVVLVAVLVARRRFTLPRAAVAAALGVYAAGILANTVFPVFLDPPTSTGPRPLPLVLVPFVDYEVGDAVTNLLVFVPLGVLLPLVLRRPVWWRVLLVAAAVSLGIETLQLLTARLAGGGHIADVDDFLWNAVGGAVGFGAHELLERFRPTSRLLERFRLVQTEA